MPGPSSAMVTPWRLGLALLGGAARTRTVAPLPAYFIALSMRLVKTWDSWSWSPTTGPPVGGTAISRFTPSRVATGSRAAALSAAIWLSETSSTGRTCSVISMRESDIRSSTSRCIRPASRAMMARKRSRASGSLRAWFCRVSI